METIETKPHPNKGLKRSDETKEKMRQSKLGRPSNHQGSRMKILKEENEKLKNELEQLKSNWVFRLLDRLFKN